MSRESSPEEGEIIEEGEIAPEPSRSSSREAGELEDTQQASTSPLSHRLERRDGRINGGHGGTHRGKRKHDPGGGRSQSTRHQTKSGRDPGAAILLSQQLRELLKKTRIAEANRNATIFCKDLSQALLSLAQLERLLKEGTAGISKPGFADLAFKVFTGLRALQIVSTTGTGKSSLPGNTAAVTVVKFAQDNLALFPPALQQEFRGWCGSGKVFGALARGEKPKPPHAKLPGPPRSTKQQAMTQTSRQQRQGHQQPPPQLPKPVTLPTPGLPKPPPGLPRPAPPPLSQLPPPRTLPPPRKPASFQIKWPQQRQQPAASQQPVSVQLNANLAAKLARFQASKAGNPALGQRAENGNRSTAKEGVPGLDVEAGAEAARARKRARLEPAEEGLSDDESDLYAAGQAPLSASHSDLSPALLQAELLEDDMGPLPPGIDVQPANKPSSGPVANGGVKFPVDEELEQEVARLFGQGREADDSSTQASPPAEPAEESGSDGAVQELLRKRKLCLVLDLDHTLVNSARWGEVDPEDSGRLEAHLDREQQQPFELRTLHSLESIHMWTKLRPACRQLLAALAEKYVMWIHTNGNRQYAEAVCAVLDPNGQLFGGRVVANAGVSPHDPAGAFDLIKRLDAQGLAGLEPITVIVDDTASVWPGHTANLMLVERYCYFPSSAKQLGLGHASLLKNNRDESPEAGMLSVVRRVLTDLHSEALRRFCNNEAGKEGPAWDVRGLLVELKSKVLRGVRILFSRLWPTDTRSEDAPLWKLAHQLGAECTTALDEAVTHVVTNTRYTEKAQKALQQGKHIVSAHWLEASAIMWKHMPESSFPVAG